MYLKDFMPRSGDLKYLYLDLEVRKIVPQKITRTLKTRADS